MKLRILCFGTMKLLFFLGVFRLVAPLYIKTKEPYNFANNRPETIDVIHVQNQKDLVGARYDHNTEQNNANYRKQNTTSQENNEVKDFSESTKKWKQNKTMLEKFYDYIKKERDSLEKQLESTDFKEDKAVMKIPRKKYQSKKGKETSNKSKRDVSSNNGIDSSKNIHHISKIKEEIAKLQDLVTILRDQQQIINLLDDMKANGTNTIQEHQQAKVDVVQKSDFSVFTKELNDLKHYVKQFLVDKLEKEIQSRTEEGNSFNKALQSQQITINNMKKLIGQIIKSNHNSNGQINNDLQVETTKDIIGELRNLEKHISEIMNQQSAPKETILGVKTPIANNQHNTPNISSKIRSSFLEDLLDDEPIKKSDDSGSEALLKILQRQLDDDDDKPSQRSETSVKKLLKLVDDAKKKKKEKDFLKKLVKTIGDKPEDRNLKIDDDLDDKLSFLKDEIDQLKPKDDDEDFEERKFGDALKKLLSQAKPGVTKHPNTNKVDSLRKKLLEVMKQPTPQRIYHHPQSSYNLCNCKPVHPYNYPQKPISSPYPYFGQLNPGLNQNYGAPPHNIQQNNFDQFGYNFDPQLFQDAPSQHYQSQPTYTGPYTQEYPDNSSPYFNGGQRENLQSQIDGLQNIINDLNNPGHIPKVDDTANLYNLNQQITDLKNVGNNLDVNNNQYSNSDYQAVQKDGYQLSGTPNSGQTQEYASNPNIPAAAPQNPTYRSSANEETLEESKPVSPKKLKNKTQNRNKRSTEDTLEDLLHRILKEEIDNEDYNTDEQNNHNLRRENE